MIFIQVLGGVYNVTFRLHYIPRIARRNVLDGDTMMSAFFV
jgi:hypothetical protein